MIDAHEIALGLWQGSFPPRGATLAKLGFDTLVLAAEELQFPADSYPGVEVIGAPNRDDGSPLTWNQLQTAVATAREVQKRLQDGKKVLVTCAAGVNRSGLVSALTLHFVYGWSGERCIQVVRERRKLSEFRQALNNQFFVQALRRLPGRQDQKPSEPLILVVVK